MKIIFKNLCLNCEQMKIIFEKTWKMKIEKSENFFQNDKCPNNTKPKEIYQINMGF